MGAFDDKVAVVTGASRGIGRAIALKFAAAGAEVALCSRGADALQELAEEISAAGGSARCFSGRYWRWGCGHRDRCRNRENLRPNRYSHQ